MTGAAPTRPATSRQTAMTRLLVLVGTTLGSTLGWWIGAPLGLMVAFIFSMIGFGCGMYAGTTLARRWS